MDDANDILADAQALASLRIDSVVQLELLLLLHQQPGRVWNTSEIAQELRIEQSWTSAQIALLVRHRLVEATADAADSYRYSPSTPEAAATVDRLACSYADRRVRLIGLIYSKPADAVRTFADAFRFRRDDKNG